MDAAKALFEQHVFVDLETTGLDPASDRVIELGALFVRGGQVVGRIERLFSPGRSVPDEVQALTGLHDDDLAGRPQFETYLPELGALLDGWTVVAHNAEFERAFLGGLLERRRIALLDSCELVHFLHPELESHSLDALVRWTGVGSSARHRALQDCEDTYAVLLRVLDAAIAGPRTEDVYDLLQCLSGKITLAAEASDPPLVSLLRGLYLACRRSSSAMTVREPAAGSVAETLASPWALVGGSGAGQAAYEERASRAYLRAFERRAAPRPDGARANLSSWFRRRFPALSVLAPEPQRPDDAAIQPSEAPEHPAS